MTRILLGIGMLTLSVAVAAQGKKEQPRLGAVAKAAQEEKAAKPAGNGKTTDATTDTAAAKKYSNEDLDRRPRPSSPSASRTAATGAAMVSSGNGGKDEEYWRSRAQSIRQRLQESTDRLSIAKARLESLKSDGIDIAVANGRSSPTAAERQRQANLVQDLEARVRRDEQAMKTLEDEGRKAGALPGWFR
jgi:hypothetical protein